MDEQNGTRATAKRTIEISETDRQRILNAMLLQEQAMDREEEDDPWWKEPNRKAREEIAALRKTLA